MLLGNLLCPKVWYLVRLWQHATERVIVFYPLIYFPLWKHMTWCKLRVSPVAGSLIRVLLALCDQFKIIYRYISLSLFRDQIDERLGVMLSFLIRKLSDSAKIHHLLYCLSFLNRTQPTTLGARILGVLLCHVRMWKRVVTEKLWKRSCEESLVCMHACMYVLNP